jgi:hypothetical protein
MSGIIQFYNPMMLDPVKNEIPYIRIMAGSYFEHEVDFTIYPTLDYREATTAEPAVLVLNAMIGEAERIVLAIEAECRRIGLIT